MATFRIIAAIVLTVAMLFVARNTSRGRPDHIVCTDNGYTFALTTVPKITALESDTLTVSISPRPDPAQSVVYRTTGPDRGKETPFESYDTRPTRLLDSASSTYGVVVTAGERGKREYYTFEVTNGDGRTRARLTTPDGAPLFVKYIGEVPPGILIPHIVFMFITVFCIVIAALHAIGLVRGAGDAHPSAFWIAIGTISAVIGGYPFGFGMNWYAFGVVWEGVPFGTDATDNKTQLLIVYFLFVMLSSLGSLTRGRFGRDLFSPNTIGRLTVGAFVFMLLIYLIPHSIQFSPLLTRVVCFGFIGLAALAYVLSLIHARRVRTIS
ncbi:hypothetical protein KQH82_09130 [bacterium]|nr:hypothetical protein [bacterium]